eukprot:6184936-Pleurochrysis_carterae.AAC.5
MESAGRARGDVTSVSVAPNGNVAFETADVSGATAEVESADWMPAEKPICQTTTAAGFIM